MSTRWYHMMTVTIGLLLVLTIVLAILATGKNMGQLVQDGDDVSVVQHDKLTYKTLRSFTESGVTFEHRCYGTSTPVIDNSDFGPMYCIGVDELYAIHGISEPIKIASYTSTGPSDAPIFSRAETVPHTAKVLLSYGIVPGAYAMDDAGLGRPTNHVTFEYTVLEDTFRPIQRYPNFGEALWNDAGTKAVFSTEQVGGAGCDAGAIIGYSLEDDSAQELTTTKACEFTGGQATDVEGNAMPMWGPLSWRNNDTLNGVLLNADGSWTIFTKTF